MVLGPNVLSKNRTRTSPESYVQPLVQPHEDSIRILSSIVRRVSENLS